MTEPGRPTRRAVLTAGIAAAGLALAGCGSSGPAGAATSISGESVDRFAVDLALMGLAAGAEMLASSIYAQILDNEQAGHYGPVPPAFRAFVETASTHHLAHAQAWNSVLAATGNPRVTGPDLSVTTDRMDQLAAATGPAAVAAVALSVESQNAETYLRVVEGIVNPGGRRIAAAVGPVESMHAAVLSFLLGRPPFPHPFVTRVGGLTLADYGGPS